MVAEIQSCQSWWLMLAVSFEQRVATVASRGVGHNRTVAAGGRRCPAPGPNATGHGAGVAGQGLAQRARVRRVGEIPQPRGAVPTAGGQGVPVATERHAINGAGVAGQGGPGGPGCAGSVRFHNRTVSSPLPEARVCPSGLNATLDTGKVWPIRGWPSGPG